MIRKKLIIIILIILINIFISQRFCNLVSFNYKRTLNIIKGSNKEKYFGKSVCLSYDGKSLAVGAWGYDNNKGLVKFYRKNTNNYLEISKYVGNQQNYYSGTVVCLSGYGKYIAFDTHNKILFGDSNNITNFYKVHNFIKKFNRISISLNYTATIIAIGNPSYNNNAGIVLIYNITNKNNFENIFKLEGKYFNNNFGYSVSLNNTGTVIAIASKTKKRGVVHLYEISTKYKPKKLYNFVVNDAFTNGSAISISLSGDGLTLAIGVPGFINKLGNIKVYELDTFKKIFEAFGRNFGDCFGNSVSLSKDGEILAVGASGYRNNTGQVKIFKCKENKVNNIIFETEGTDENDYYGISISLSGNGRTVAIGASGNRLVTIKNF